MKQMIKAAGAAVVLAVALTGCTAVDEARNTLDQAQEKVDDAQAYVESVREEVGHATDLTLEELQSFDFSRLDEDAGTFLGDNSKVVEFMRSMPSGQDMQNFEVKGSEGTLVVNYGNQVLEADPAVLQQTMEEISAQAKEHIQNLETVEFRVGENTYTF
ncbi:DUF4825 domain-containing protein [Micrococcus terreus]|uniref:DUF4825 domain-containing protein n=1 Tax=Micrococcus terreus TaxID=574650 RepID=UPI0021A89852|nr:DUF4825 domain-containing protein [Micrococcus terreus]MCT2089787.1 DUF4825 domain-containing protein [Micrococcus terreus]